jgi:hypothetical protein
VTLVTLVAAVVAIYCAIKFTPIYIEKSRINRAVQQAANAWMNTTPNLVDVRNDLKYNLGVAQVKSITADDVQFVSVNSDEGMAYVQYTIIVKHPIKQIKPTKLKFKVQHTAKRGTTW